METVMVRNEATLACCGEPVANGQCSCGGHAVEKQKPTPIYVPRFMPVGNDEPIRKPTPLGLPVMNFEPEQKVDTEAPRQRQTAVRNTTADGIPIPKPLGLPVMEF